jgi:NhaP-type Na+/H+ or K+/H+ antiporter
MLLFLMIGSVVIFSILGQGLTIGPVIRRAASRQTASAERSTGMEAKGA